MLLRASIFLPNLFTTLVDEDFDDVFRICDTHRGGIWGLLASFSSTSPILCSYCLNILHPKEMKLLQVGKHTKQTGGLGVSH
jgi:hypothetical protein